MWVGLTKNLCCSTWYNIMYFFFYMAFEHFCLNGSIFPSKGFYHGG